MEWRTNSPHTRTLPTRNPSCEINDAAARRELRRNREPSRQHFAATVHAQTMAGLPSGKRSPNPASTSPHHRLKLYQGWWSGKEAAAQVTVVTGLNPTRLNQLESQCRRWRGPISAAVYVVVRNPNKGAPLPEDQRKKLEEAAAQVDEFHNRWVAAAWLLPSLPVRLPQAAPCDACMLHSCACASHADVLILCMCAS